MEGAWWAMVVARVRGVWAATPGYDGGVVKGNAT
jgi:hypothetical protein